MYLSKYLLDMMAIDKTETIGFYGSLNADPSTNAIPPSLWAARVGLFGCGGTAITILGFIGALMSLVTFASFQQKATAPRLLMWLAGFGGILLFSSMFLDTLPAVSKGGLISEQYLVALRPIFARLYAVPHISQTTVTYMTVVVTVERFLAVVKPLHVSRIFGYRASWIAGIGVLSWALVYHIPLYLAYTYDAQPPSSDGIQMTFHRTAYGDSPMYNYWYVIWVNFTMEFLVPFVILTVLNTAIIVTLTRAKAFQANNSRCHPREVTRLNIMILAVTATFFFCQLFPATALIMVSGHNRYEDCSLSCNLFTAIADTMVLVNPAANFFLYFAIGDKFRRRLLACFCRPIRQHLPSPSSSMSSANGTRTPLSQQTKLPYG